MVNIKKRGNSRKKSSRRTVSRRKAHRRASAARAAPKTTHIESIILHATKINPVYFGIANGAASGIGFFVIGLLSSLANFARPFVQIMSTLFIGYDSSFIGALIGGVWAFVYLTVLGMIVSAFYNTLHH